MKERPILFSGPMVRALLDGSKTQTRRAIKTMPENHAAITSFCHLDGQSWRLFGDRGTWMDVRCPYGAPGDRLWVRESFSGPHHRERTPPRDWHSLDEIHYWADGNPGEGDWTKPRPGMFMPRWASRITLEVVSMRVERLQDISEVDSLAEGCEARPFPGPWWQGYKRDDEGELHHQQVVGEEPPDWMVEPHKMKPLDHLDVSAKAAYQLLWNRINGPDSWAANPWVWVVEFKRLP